MKEGDVLARESPDVPCCFCAEQFCIVREPGGAPGVIHFGVVVDGDAGPTSCMIFNELEPDEFLELNRLRRTGQDWKTRLAEFRTARISQSE